MKGDKVSFTPMFVLTFLNAFTLSVLSTLISMYAMIYFWATTFEVSLLSSVSSLAMLILTVPGGLLSDKIGRKIILILGMASNVLSFVFVYVAPGFFLLLVSMMLSGVAFAIFGPTMQSLIADLAEMGTRKKAVGLYTVVASGGFSSGPVMCSLLLQFVSIKDILLITLGIASIELIMGILLVKERSHGGEAGLIGKNFGNVIRNGNVMYASLALASFFFVDSSIMTFFPIAALNVYGLTPQFVSSVFALRNIVLLFSRVFVVTRVVGKISEKKLFSISLALPLSLALTFFLTGYLSLSIFIILVGVGVGIVFSMGAMIIADSTSSQERGLANAIYFVGMNGGTTLSPIIMGALADVIGVTMIFPVAAFVPVIGLLASLMIKMK